jgi:hypothetical protein
MDIRSAAEWRAFESEQWYEAVRDRSLELRSLEVDERRLVFDALTLDLERRKRQRQAQQHSA